MNPPSSSTNPSPGDGAPLPGSEAWHQAQALRGKLNETGASTATPSDQKIRQFQLVIDVNEELTDDAPAPNLYDLHKGFVTQLLAIAGADTHLIPTAQSDSEDAATLTPILSAEGFPESEGSHRRFFRRQFIRRNTNKTTVNVYHSILSKTDVKDLKEKLMPYLRMHKLWMKGGDLLQVETGQIGWLLGAHPSMTYRPDILAHITGMLAVLPQSIVKEAVEEHGSPEDLEKLPDLFLNSRPHHFGIEGSGGGRVSTYALTISCRQDRTRLVKELISSIPDGDLEYPFVPLGLANILSVSDYKKVMIINNDRQNAVQGITVHGFSTELFRSLYISPDGDDKYEGYEVNDYFKASPAIISIEKTAKSSIIGRYIFIVDKEKFDDAKDLIDDFCRHAFRKIYRTSIDRDNYKQRVGSFPRLLASASAGGAVASLGARLGAFLKAEEASSGVIEPSSLTWAQRTAPRLVFERHFPSLTTTPSPAPPTNPPASSSSTASTTSSTATRQASIAGGTMISQDVSTVITEMRSIMTEQTEFIKQMMARQEKQDEMNRQAAADAREAAKEAAKEAREAARESAKETRMILEAAQKSSADSQQAMQQMLQMMLGFQTGQTPWPTSGRSAQYTNTPPPIPTPTEAGTPPSATSDPSSTTVPPPPPAKPPVSTPGSLSSDQSPSVGSFTTPMSIDAEKGRARPRTPGSTPQKDTKNARTDCGTQIQQPRQLFGKDPKNSTTKLTPLHSTAKTVGAPK